MLLKKGFQLRTASTQLALILINSNNQETQDFVGNDKGQRELDYVLRTFDSLHKRKVFFKNNLPCSQCAPVKPEGHKHRYFFSVNPD